jgi:hypothetical protein
MKYLAAIVFTLVVICTAAPKSRWKIEVAKKASIVTGSNDVVLSNVALKGNTIIVLGCNGGKPMFRIAENFKVANGVNNALTKSELQRQMQKGPQYETFGFAFKVVQGDLYETNVKFRLEGQTNFL